MADNMLTKKGICLILFLIIWLAACSRISNSNNVSLATTVVVPDLLPHSMKGYELYSWLAGDDWHFTLITGTNRLKTLEEITLGEDVVTPDGWVSINVVGVDALKKVLTRLPPDEEILWVGGKGFQAGEFELPDQGILSNIQTYCQQLELVLSLSE